MQFEKATKKKSKLRLLISGPSGSGKTYTALEIAKPFGKAAVIDTEHGSASLYADLFNFDVLNLDKPTMENAIQAIEAAERGGFDIIICDSLTHYWTHALEEVDRISSSRFSGNKWSAWSDVTPRWNRMVYKIITCKAHIICTSRSKSDYIIEADEKTGKSKPKKVGMAPILRDQMEYEFTLAGDMDLDHTFSVSKTRCPEFTDAVINRPTSDFGVKLLAWLESGEDVPEPAPPSARDELIALLKNEVGCAKSDDYETAVRFVTDGKTSAADCKDPEKAGAVLAAIKQTHAAGVPYTSFLKNGEG